MSTVVILGAGPIGGALASAISWGAICENVVLVDEAEDVAAGKALDIRQSCAIAGSDTRLTARASPADLKDADIIAVADRASDGSEWQGEGGLSLLKRVFAGNLSAPVVLTGCNQAWLLERAILELGRSPRTIVGTGVHALETALRVILGLEADRPATDVSLTVVGRPPRKVAILWDAARIADRPALDGLDASALRRIESRTGALWPPGPYALAASASFAIRTMLAGSSRTMTCLVVRESSPEAVALPVTLGTMGVERMVAPVLDNRVRLALG